MAQDEHAPEDVPGSLSLSGAVSLGTGVMIGAGIFALTGQVAALAGRYFPLAFAAAALVTGFSAYSYVKLSNAFPSSGGIAMFLKEAYGLGTATGVFAVLMYFSMVINESLVARTFGAYVLQILPLQPGRIWIPVLGTLLIAGALALNVSGNRALEGIERVMAALKVVGLAVFSAAALWTASASNLLGTGPDRPVDPSAESFLAASALAVLAYKGFTTITNSGGEIVDPHRNTGRAIVLAIGICTTVYMVVALAVAGNLPLDRIIEARDFALAEASQPVLGRAGLWFTVAIAVIATASGIVASIFAASRMLAMLTRMHEVPHRHFGLPGTIRTHTTVYTATIAVTLTVLLDLTRIAALGAIFYLVMDIAVHWGILRHLRDRVRVRTAVVVTAILLDVVILVAFAWVKGSADPFVLYVAAAGMAAIVAGERLFMWSHTNSDGSMNM